MTIRVRDDSPALAPGRTIPTAGGERNILAFFLKRLGEFMATLATSEITRLLESLSDGDRAAAVELLPLVYDELRGLAGGLMQAQKAGHTLQPTALVHEAYLRLAGNNDRKWSDRTHFFRVAAVAMRHLLVQHARNRGRLKRGGDWRRVPLDDAVAMVEENTGDLVALDECLTRFAAFDHRAARVVELRFFGGLSVAETAETLDLSDRTVEKDWQAARLWLSREMDQA